MSPSSDRMRTCAACGLTFDARKERVATGRVRRPAAEEGAPAKRVELAVPRRSLAHVAICTGGLGMIFAQVALSERVAALVGIPLGALMGLGAISTRCARLAVEGHRLTRYARFGWGKTRLARDETLQIETADERVLARTGDRELLISTMASSADADLFAHEIRAALEAVPLTR